MNPNHLPLAEKMRPSNLDEIVGQNDILSDTGLIKMSITSQKPISLILWGPPGCGKTSLASLYARAFSMRFIKLSAVFSGIADLKKIIKEEQSQPLFSQGVFLFVDEIHRFNKAQQDAFLPFIENGTIYLIGATTENPSFYLNNALLSRMRVIPMKPLEENALNQLLEKSQGLDLTSDAKQLLIQRAQGDGRYLFNLVENLLTSSSKESMDVEQVSHLLNQKAAMYDRDGDQHFNLISALHKSVRGSDPDAALYWFSRMLEGGEDPLYLARRLIRMATEDVGLADPQALSLAIAARDTFQMLGSPEGELALAEVVVYLALAPKSNAIYKAYKASRQAAAETTHFDPPKIILNAPTKLMKQLDYGKGYEYDHETPMGFSGQDYFPEGMERTVFYEPVERGFEREMKKRKDYFTKLRVRGE
ncbi:MAG: Replication-associated recombination protein A [Chlamydiae bacterium]|nr:Replication-associated recombination protein A [Chlamydiota bacterium]